MPWNPNAPDSLGMEWAPSRADTFTVGAEGSGYAIAWQAESTRQLVALGAGIEVTSPGEWTMELYREADYLTAMSEPIQHASFSPTADKHIHPSCWSWPNDVQPYAQWLVGAPGSPGNANHVVLISPFRAPWTDSFYAGQYSGLAIPGGQRLLAVRLRHDRAVYNAPDPNNTSWLEYGFADPADGSGRITSDERITSGGPRQTVEYTFRPRNVLTSSNHSAALATWAAAGSGWGLFFNSYSGSNLQADCFHQQLVADYVPERRLAWATGIPLGGGTVSGTAPVGPLANHFSQIATPGGTPVTITAGQRYVTVIRGPRYSDLPAFVGRLIALSGGPPIVGYSGGRVRFDSNGLPTQRVPTDSVGAPLYTTQTGPPTIAPDSDPFPLQGVSTVMGALPARQRFTVTAPTTIGQFVVPVARANYPNAAPLMFRLTTTAGVGIGSSVALDVARWDAIPNPYVMGGRTIKNCRVDLAAGVALAPGDYYISVTCPDTFPLDGSVTPWGILYLESFTSSITPTPRFEPVGPYSGRNSAILAVSQPAPMTNFRATRRTEVLAAPSGCAGTWDAVDLTWTPAVLADPTAFLRYEIERQDDAPTGQWERIAHILDPAASSFSDREQRRARPTAYRLRMMRVDGGTSAWATSGPAISIRALCCGIGLVSNHAEVPSLFFADVEPARKYENLDASGLITRPTYGRDYQLAFHPVERRGVRFETNLLVHDGTGTRGLEHFDTLRTLARADLPHVTVLDELGTRILAAIAVADLEVRPNRFRQSYFSSFLAVEVSGQPVVSVIEAPPESLPVAGTFHMGPHPNDKLDSNFFMGFR